MKIPKRNEVYYLKKNIDNYSKGTEVRIGGYYDEERFDQLIVYPTTEHRKPGLSIVFDKNKDPLSNYITKSLNKKVRRLS